MPYALETPQATVEWLIQYVKDNGFSKDEIAAVKDVAVRLSELDEENTMLAGKLADARRERDHAHDTLIAIDLALNHRHPHIKGNQVIATFSVFKDGESQSYSVEAPSFHLDHNALRTDSFDTVAYLERDDTWRLAYNARNYTTVVFS